MTKVVNLPCCELPNLTPHILVGEDGVYESVCRKCKKRATTSISPEIDDKLSDQSNRLL